MALPKHIRPEYSTKLAATGKTIKYMPFSVREEKVLVLAAESEDNDEITNAITNVLNNCITTPDIKVEDLALFDIQHIFLKCRAKSAGEKLKLKVKDPNDESFEVEHEIHLEKIQVEKTEGHTDLISISNDVKVKMKYPGIQFFADGLAMDGIQEVANSIAACISQLVVGEEVFNRSDMTDEEIKDWVDDLQQKDVESIVAFFKTMPKLRHSFKLRNTKTDKDFTIQLDGLQDFF